ncbi:MAG: transcription termination/antitermination protein NusG [candidate division WOR-3 bacterium]|nr:transcription termination/antitermination protein NusG [candidate division WOR-3 bacterium]MDH5683136.1 transcription termination/antitermination protein NusG [candidate division WOR-3 bacterium]
MKYFVVHTYTGREKRVKELLERAIDNENLKILFGQIILPAERITKIKKSELISEERRLYPGYIVVEMEPIEQAINLVTSIPGVTHMLGTKTKPLPLTESEVKSVLEQIERSREQVATEVPFTQGENVKVVSGPFAGFMGTVDEIHSERRRVKVMVTIFGRSTPIDLDFLEVQSI